jgi:hypothetical protein
MGVMTSWGMPATTTTTITDKKYITKTDITTFDWNWGGFGILIHAVGT